MISPFSARQVACPICCMPVSADPLNVQSGTNVPVACPLSAIDSGAATSAVRTTLVVRRSISAPDTAADRHNVNARTYSAPRFSLSITPAAGAPVSATSLTGIE